MKAQLHRPTLWLVTGIMMAAIATTLSMRDAAWVGDPLWGQESIGVAQVLVLPLLAGAAATVGWHDSEGILTLVPAGGLRFRHISNTLAAWAIPVVALYALANLVVVLTSMRSDPSIPNAALWPVLTQACAAVLTFVVGYALGVLLTSWLSAVVAALLTAAVLILDRMGAIATGLAEYAASGTMLGTVPHASYFVMRLVWMGMVGAVIVALLGTGRRHRVGLVVALGAAVLTGQFAFASNDSYTFMPARAGSCTSPPVVVCAPPEFRARAERASQIASETAGVLQELGVSSRSRFVMWQPGRDRMDHLMLVNPGKLRAPLMVRDVVSGVVAPESCGLWYGAEPPPGSWFYSRALVESYVVSELSGHSAEPYGRLRSTEGAEASRKLVTEAAAALQECDLGRVPKSFGSM